ncbi:hypothetical protein GCM10027589_10890 [Actinocorallia lasiicapitis]
MIMIKALTCTFSLIAGLTGAVSSEAPRLFDDTAADPATLSAKEPWELRHRLAAADPEVLRPWCGTAPVSPATITLDLFPDTAFTATASLVNIGPQGTLRWRGALQDLPDSAVTLSAVGLCDADTRFALAGSVRVNGEDFAIEPRSNGRVMISEIDTTAAGLLQRPGADSLRKAPTAAARVNAAAAAQRRATGTNSVIDALVLVTPGAEAQAGGRDEIEAWVQDAASRANDNLADSGVKTAFRVVGVEHVAYTGKETVQPGYNALSNQHDGSLDDAATLRERYGADVVTLVVGGYDPADGIAGLAVTPENPQAASTSGDIWSVVAANQLWAYVLPHEWGHLLGLEHDWSTSPTPNPYYPDNHGYLPGNDRFVTIMGYPSACSPRPCPYTPYFSNPDLSTDGQPLGVRIGTSSQPSNAARVMNLTAPQVAAYRTPRDPLPDLALTVTATAGGTAQSSAPGPFAYGDVVSATAAPAPGYVFDSWQLNGASAGSANPLNVSVRANSTLVAKFIVGTGQPQRLTSATAPSGVGKIVLTPPGGVYTQGTQVKVTARDTTGHRFAGWLLDGSEAGDDPVLTVQMSRPHSLVARYVGDQPMLDVFARPPAGGQVQLSEPSPSGDVIAKATVTAGYRFKRWLLDGMQVGTQPVLAMTVVGQDSLVAEFTPPTVPPKPKPPVKKPVKKPAKAKPKVKKTQKKAKAKKKVKKKKKASCRCH